MFVNPAQHVTVHGGICEIGFLTEHQKNFCRKCRSFRSRGRQKCSFRKYLFTMSTHLRNAEAKRGRFRLEPVTHSRILNFSAKTAGRFDVSFHEGVFRQSVWIKPSVPVHAYPRPFRPDSVLNRKETALYRSRKTQGFGCDRLNADAQRNVVNF